jgi:hypothetical protein
MSKPTDDNQDDNQGDNEQGHDAGKSIHRPIQVPDDPFTDSRQSPEEVSESTRKVAKTSLFCAPSLSATPKPGSRVAPLETPDSHDYQPVADAFAPQHHVRRLFNASPTPARPSERVRYQPTAPTDLASVILELVRAEYPGLRVTTEIQIRHEVGMAMGAEATRLQQSKETIAELRKRVDELEESALKKRVNELEDIILRLTGE